MRHGTQTRAVGRKASVCWAFIACLGCTCVCSEVQPTIETNASKTNFDSGRTNPTIEVKVVPVGPADRSRAEIWLVTNPSVCPRPYYVVRAFGSDLHAFIPQPRDPTTMAWDTTVLRGGGTYVIDIALLTCEAYHYGHPNESRCLFQPPIVVHRRAHDFGNNSSSSATTPPSVWRLKPGLSVSTIPKDTRFQTAACFYMKKNVTAPSAPECDVPSPASASYSRAPTVKPQFPQGMICVIGASHGERWTKGFARLGSPQPLQDRLRYIKCRFAEHIGNIQSAELLNCTNLLVSTLQWDLGWPGGRITPAGKLRHDLGTSLVHLRHSAPHAKVWLVSTNYNPLGIAIMSPCTPDIRPDWRAPDIIDRYNAIAEHVAAQIDGVEYVDNNIDIVGPFWDAAIDWCHPDTPVFDALVDKLSRLMNHDIRVNDNSSKT